MERVCLSQAQEKNQLNSKLENCYPYFISWSNEGGERFRWRCLNPKVIYPLVNNVQWKIPLERM